MSNEQSQIERRIDKVTTGQTGLTATGAMAFKSMNEIMEFAKVMAIAGVAVPKHLRENPGACLGVAIQASEWQMSPFAVANKSYVVNDRLGYEAQLVNAVILRRAPIIGRIRVEYSGEGEGRKCKVLVRCDDGDVIEHESPAFGRITTKNSPLWKADPDQQLFYYTSRAMCRRHFPDVLLGVYTADELQAHDRTERVVSGREIPPVLKPIEEPTKTEVSLSGKVGEFWNRCGEVWSFTGWARKLSEFLYESELTFYSDPSKLTEEEAAYLLTIFDRIVETFNAHMEGGPNIAKAEGGQQ